MKPPVFAALDLADALERSQKENKLLLVDAAAEWCQPCKIMDQTTWSDPKVVEALAPIAIAIQIDVDQRAEDAASLKIKAMPTGAGGPFPSDVPKTPVVITSARLVK